jgi:hypothetical protein
MADLIRYASFVADPYERFTAVFTILLFVLPLISIIIYSSIVESDLWRNANQSMVEVVLTIAIGITVAGSFVGGFQGSPHEFFEADHKLAQLSQSLIGHVAPGSFLASFMFVLITITLGCVGIAGIGAAKVISKGRLLASTAVTIIAAGALIIAGFYLGDAFFHLRKSLRHLFLQVWPPSMPAIFYASWLLGLITWGIQTYRGSWSWCEWPKKFGWDCDGEEAWFFVFVGTAIALVTLWVALIVEGRGVIPEGIPRIVYTICIPMFVCGFTAGLGLMMELPSLGRYEEEGFFPWLTGALVAGVANACLPAVGLVGFSIGMAGMLNCWRIRNDDVAYDMRRTAEARLRNAPEGSVGYRCGLCGKQVSLGDVRRNQCPHCDVRWGGRWFETNSTPVHSAVAVCFPWLLQFTGVLFGASGLLASAIVTALFTGATLPIYQRYKDNRQHPPRKFRAWWEKQNQPHKDPHVHTRWFLLGPWSTIIGLIGLYQLVFLPRFGWSGPLGYLIGR